MGPISGHHRKHDMFRQGGIPIVPVSLLCEPDRGLVADYTLFPKDVFTSLVRSVSYRPYFGYTGPLLLSRTTFSGLAHSTFFIYCSDGANSMFSCRSDGKVRLRINIRYPSSKHNLSPPGDMEPPCLNDAILATRLNEVSRFGDAQIGSKCGLPLPVAVERILI